MGAWKSRFCAAGRLGRRYPMRSTRSWRDWRRTGGFGPPGGQGDWAASVHDYNFQTNGITIGSYFDPNLSPATAKALIQSDNNLIRNAGGMQSAKMGLFFGTVNAFQWYANRFK
jgi:hypothetical protein